MTPPLKRAIRTFGQTFLGLYLIRLVGFLGQLSEWAGCAERGEGACAFPDVGALGYGLVVAGSAAVVALISFVQNYLEDNTSFPALLKSPPASVYQPPTTFDSDAGHSQLELIMMVAILIISVVLLFIHL